MLPKSSRSEFCVEKEIIFKPNARSLSGRLRMWFEWSETTTFSIPNAARDCLLQAKRNSSFTIWKGTTMRRKRSENQTSYIPLTRKIANGAKMLVRGLWETAVVVVLACGICLAAIFPIGVIFSLGGEHELDLRSWFRLGASVATLIAILMSVPAAIFFAGALKKRSVAGGIELLGKTENWFRPTGDARVCTVCGTSSTKMCKSWWDASINWEACTNCGSYPKNIEQIRYCKKCDTHFCAQCGAGLKVKTPPPSHGWDGWGGW